MEEKINLHLFLCSLKFEKEAEKPIVMIQLYAANCQNIYILHSLHSL